MPKENALQKIKVCFKDVAGMTLEQVYGIKPIPVTELASAIWRVIKKHNLRQK